MYSLYIPKYQNDPISARHLPEELGRFMSVTNYAYDLLISPGYLSRTDKTINQFLTEMEKELAALGRGWMGRDRVGLGLFHGMNGYHPVVKGGSSTILDAHDMALTGRRWLEKIMVDPRKQDDHRKMIFFFERRKWDITRTLNTRNMGAFLDEITVEAVLIGSSNFSWSTYYNGGKKLPEKGEADLLMFADEKKYMGDVRDRIYEGLDIPVGTQMVLFKSLAGGDRPQEFFKEMLRDFLTHSLN